MKKRKMSLPLVLGICLILCSLCLALVFGIRTYIGFRKCQQAISELYEILPERTPGVPGIYPDPGMPVLEIDGEDYVAVVEIPAYGVALPVADGWDSNGLSCSPARFWGSAYNGTLVIGGGDYPQQFDFCDKIGLGALVTVTDMTGARFSYSVSGVDRAKHAQAQWLTGADCDLTLFCHDIFSMEYIAVRCVLASG